MDTMQVPHKGEKDEEGSVVPGRIGPPDLRVTRSWDRSRTIEEADLPRWVEEDIINFFNDPTPSTSPARTRIPSTRVVLGDVAALGGPFTIAGEVDGDLVVVNGDLVFEAGGLVTGDVLVVGGRIFGEDVGEVGGDLRVFDEPLRYVQRGDQISSAGRPEEREGFGPDFPWGDARFTVKSGQNYNRTEGLPVMFGPSFRTAGSNPLRLDLLGIWRTDMGFELNEDDFGYALRAEQALGGRNNISVGGTFFSMVDPIEDWGLTNLEASLTTFILHEDYRDYYERQGWSAFAKFQAPLYTGGIQGRVLRRGPRLHAGGESLVHHQERRPLAATAPGGRGDGPIPGGHHHHGHQKRPERPVRRMVGQGQRQEGFGRRPCSSRCIWSPDQGPA